MRTRAIAKIEDLPDVDFVRAMHEIFVKDHQGLGEPIDDDTFEMWLYGFVPGEANKPMKLWEQSRQE